ncbi:CHAT domain-containing protein [Pseudosporangium ferrugineum]|uniref:CHAT domain-containing protein n=1 Tax=Pseudosporangium ferrugineum TaxID=439699 RepID=A0A2T0SIT5_9ACTN|nr:CHAT domain-containing protein [Pseudosporangium ferrugineum]
MDTQLLDTQHSDTELHPEVGLREEADAAYRRVTLDPARYADAAEVTLRRARAGSDVEALVAALRAVGWSRHVALDNEGARELLDQGVRLARRHGLDRRLGDLLVSRAVALHELGRYDAAARDLRTAEPLIDPADRPELRLQLAVLDHNRGRIVPAARAYRDLLDDPACPPIVLVKAANNLAHAQTLLGRPHEALVHLDRAAVLAGDLGPRLTAVIANSRAWSSFHAGRLAESVRHFEEAGRLHAAAGLPLGEHHVEYADVLRDLRLLDEAMAAARSAAADFERHGARLMAAEARLRVAQLALELGDPETAGTEAASAVQDFRRQRRPAWAARATVAEAEALAARDGYSPAVLRRLRRAAATLEGQGLRAEAAYGHLAAGRAALALHRPVAARTELTAVGRLAEGQSLLVRLRGHIARALLAEAEQSGDVLRECVRGLRDLARHRAALPSLELRVLASGHGAELGEVGLRRLLPTGTPGSILEWLERTRAAALLRVQPPASGVDDDVVALRGIAQELRVARLERGEEPAALLARQSTLEARIRRRSWTSDDPAGEAAPVSGAALRRALDGEWLLEYAVIADRVLAVVVEAKRTRIVELGPLEPIRQEAGALMFGLRRLLHGTKFSSVAHGAARDAVDALTRLLIAPIGVPADVPLVVVPSAHFLGMPWSALHRAPVSVSPSAGLWARARRTPVKGPSDDAGRARVAVVAGPDLAGALAEADAVAALHPGARTLVPPDSTVDATIDLIKDADLAHLACHGLFRSDSPLFSALELSDGRLTLYEMLTRGVAPHRIVLASCNSGAQRSYGGNEVLGFVGAMMSHGSAGITATDLPIPDGACAGCMAVLHDRISHGDSLATAVWHARQALADGGPEEYVAWCGLTAYGPG